MSNEMHVEFRYEDLVSMEMTGKRPRGYVEKILRSGKKRFGTVYMTIDAYKAFVAKYSDKPGGKIIGSENKSSRRIVVPKAKTKPILGPTGLPLQSGCCGKGSTKHLQIA